MRQLFLAIFLLSGVLASAQTKKKKTYKKKPTPVKKVVVEKPVIKDTAIAVSTNVSPIETIVAEPKPQEEPQEEAYMNSVRKLEKKKGWISNRNSYGSRGMWAYLKGVYSGNNKMYIMIELENTTNINYDLETISFLSRNTEKNKKELESEDKVLVPIWQTEFETLPKKEKKKLLFVFDKFTLAENKALMFIMDEKEGERTIEIPIYSKYINGAEFIK